MRLVLDTNVVVSGLLWDGLPSQLVRAGRDESIELFTSAWLIAELSHTLSYPRLGKKIDASGFSVGQLVNMYSRFAVVVEPTPVPRLAPDLDDDVVIGTAIAAKADFIVTGDKPLLSVQIFAGGRIISVREALDAIGGNLPHGRQ
jgi:putative PIN family toxin of toxin-antitoxin system